MIPYITSTRKNNAIECNADLVVTHNNTLVMMSLIDIAGKVRKVFSDIILGKGKIVLHDRKDFFKEDLLRTYSYCGKRGVYKYKLSKHNDKMTHGIIHNTAEDNYMYDWNGEGLVKTLTLFLRNKHYLPITEEIVQKVIDKAGDNLSQLVDKCVVVTSKDDMKHVEVWYFNSVEYFKTVLEDIELDTKNTNDNFDWDMITDISDYLVTFADPIQGKMSDSVDVLYDKDNVSDKIFDKLTPYEGQIPLIQGGIETLKRKENRFLYLAGDPGIGKTVVSTKINHVYHHEKNKDNYCTLVVAPTTTLTQWKNELKRTIAEDIDVMIISNTDEFIRFYNDTKLKVDKPTYILVGKETFKLSYKTEHGVNVSKRMVEVEVEREYSTSTEEQVIEVCTCPDCGVPLTNPLRKSKTVYFTEKDFDRPKKSNYKCTNCDSVLWQATYVRNRKTSVVDFIKKRNITFDSLILDEAHESNNFDTIIGQATREVLKRAKKSILLSGTVTNGYASSIYNILFALIPNTLRKDNVFSKEEFIKAYGTLEAVTKNKDNEYYIMSRTQLRESDYQEVEGINPLVFTRYFANNFIFAELREIRSDLPELKEYYIEVDHLDDVLSNERELRESIKKASPYNASFYNDSVIKHYANKPFDWSAIPFEYSEDSDRQDEFVQPRNIDNILLPKEIELINICKREKEENRKTWVYCDYVTNGKYTDGEALIDRLKRKLEENGLSVYVLKSTVRTLERKKVIESNKDKYDVFISNPRLVNVGLNMQWCPNYVFYSPSYHVNIVRQASLRGLRADSTEENRVYHLAYNDGIEKEILERFKLKLVESESAQAKFDSNVDVQRTASSLGAKIEKELAVVV